MPKKPAQAASSSAVANASGSLSPSFTRAIRKWYRLLSVRPRVDLSSSVVTRLLAPEPAALFRLLQHPPSWASDTDIEELRGSTEEFSVALRDMSALQERIKLLQEEIAAQVNEENNRSLFVLTVVTVMALPINLIAGLLGMNVGGIPLAQHPHGFWIVLGVIAGFTSLAAWLARRRRRDR